MSDDRELAACAHAPAELRQPSDPSPRVRLSYLLSLALVAALILSGFLAIRLLASVLETAPAAINQAGRQRMLSERLAKDALRLLDAEAAVELADRRRDLQRSLAVWARSHERLRRQVYGSEGSFASRELRAALARAESPYRALHAACDELLVAFAASGTTIRERRAPKRAVGRILAHEESYLAEVEHVVSLHEAQALSRVTRLERLATLLTLSGLIVLAIVALFVLEPAVRRIRRQFRDTSRMIEQAGVATRRIEQRKNFLEKLFGRYLSEPVANRILDTSEGARLGGEERKVTLLMSDLRGFSALAARSSPQTTVTLLNRYLESMTEVIVAHEGTINEFEGDRIFAMFGAPLRASDDAHRAAACALSMQVALGRLSRTFGEQGLAPLRAGIALHTGTVVAGNVGSVRRAKYGVVGVPVILTSRLEECALPGQVLVSEAALQELRDDARLGSGVRVEVKGFDGPIAAYELLGLKGLPLLAPRLQPGPMVSLPEPLPIGYRKVVGHQLGRSQLGGRITRISAEQADIELLRTTCCVSCSCGCSSPMLELQEELEIQLAPRQSDADAVAYAQVTNIVSGQAEAFRVFFTSMTPAAQAFLGECVDGAAQRAAGEAGYARIAR